MTADEKIVELSAYPRSKLLRFGIDQFNILKNDSGYRVDERYFHRHLKGKVHAGFEGSLVRFLYGPSYDATLDKVFPGKVTAAPYVHLLYNLMYLRYGNIRATFSLKVDNKLYRKFLQDDYYPIDMTLEVDDPKLMKQLEEMAVLLESVKL